MNKSSVRKRGRKTQMDLWVEMVRERERKSMLCNERVRDVVRKRKIELQIGRIVEEIGRFGN